VGRIVGTSLERDMKDARWFVDKIRTSDSYAQNLYAALCNNAFQKLDVIPVLRDEVWSCTWRYAGGVVADIRCEGDYMDWYCSGIFGDPKEIDYAAAEAQGFDIAKYVAESVVTDEIKQDLKQLGWIVVEDYYDDGI
jgi:hypothetical protein